MEVDLINNKLDHIIKIFEKIEENSSKITKKESNEFDFDIKMYIKCLIHELRTPISNISLGLNILAKKIMEEQKQKMELNNNTIENIQTLNDLNKSIEYIEHTFTKFCVLQNGLITLNKFEPFSLKELLSRVEILLHYNINERNILFNYSIDNNVYDWVYGDSYNIKHTLVNLLKNAIKYSDSNINKKVTINVSCTENNENDNKQYLIFYITDYNIPIPSHIKKNLFQAFNSTSGSGLGLYICRQIIELHKGIVYHEYLNNNEGNNEGNNFIIKLELEKCKDNFLHINNQEINEQIQQDNMSLEEKTHTSFEISISNMNLVKYNIIIIDDSEINIKMMYKIFKENKKIKNIFTAVDGLDAINKIYNNMDNIDIVFIDNQMPNLNGAQTVKLLRGVNFNKLIIGITGSFNDELSNFKNSGVDFVISKPLEKNKIDMLFNFINKYGMSRIYDKTIKIVNFQMEWM